MKRTAGIMAAVVVLGLGVYASVRRGAAPEPAPHGAGLPASSTAAGTPGGSRGSAEQVAYARRVLSARADLPPHGMAAQAEANRRSVVEARETSRFPERLSPMVPPKQPRAGLRPTTCLARLMRFPMRDALSPARPVLSPHMTPLGPAHA
jgi:hypothetical protein